MKEVRNALFTETPPAAQAVDPWDSAVCNQLLWALAKHHKTHPILAYHVLIYVVLFFSVFLLMRDEEHGSTHTHTHKRQRFSDRFRFLKCSGCQGHVAAQQLLEEVRVERERRTAEKQYLEDLLMGLRGFFG